MTEVWVAFGVALAPWAALTYVRLKRFLHILQLEEYDSAQFLRWLREHWTQHLPLAVFLPVILSLLAAMILVGIGSATIGGIGVGVWLVAGVLVLSKSLRSRHEARKPLVMTSRARRLLVVSSLAAAILIGIATGIGSLFAERHAIAEGIFVATGVYFFGGHVLVLANLMLWPFEEVSRRRFMKLAAAKLAARRPRVIAITGSAGKTTTKELVAHLLSARYRVLKTPASFNTPLGIARTVNDSYDGQEFFVVEMGAYKRGEIERLCALVGGTDVSVITTVNAQHLERFGSLEATARAKWEIVEGLRAGGTAVLNFDVAAIRELAKTRVLRHPFGAQDERVIGEASRDEEIRELAKTRVLRQAQDERIKDGAGAEGENEAVLRPAQDGLILREPQDERGKTLLSFGVEAEDVMLRGTNVVETRTGIELDVTFGGETAHFVTRLLARHNATNVLAAVGVGLTCGLELAYMAAAVRQFAAPEHRLQPLQMENGVTVLDDAYNANPEGIIGALEVLGAYAPRRRIVVTPGLIEMGREKAAYHGRIGRAAAKCADVAVLVGPKQTADIRAAMLEASFPAERLYVAKGLAEAQEVLRRIGEPGDVILYANDLPDQFDEFLTI